MASPDLSRKIESVKACTSRREKYTRQASDKGSIGALENYCDTIGESSRRMLKKAGSKAAADESILLQRTGDNVLIVGFQHGPAGWLDKD